MLGGARASRWLAAALTVPAAGALVGCATVPASADGSPAADDATDAAWLCTSGCSRVPASGFLSPPIDYADRAAWLCLPGRADPCAADLSTTVVAADGSLTVEPSPPAAATPTLDCFYVYPTVSTDPGDNSDMVPGPEEARVAVAQFARFRTACRTFAPLYRQMTLTGLRQAMMAGTERRGADLAYQDVSDAFTRYLDHDNGGRPFALIGHSQGAALLKRLVAERIDGRPIARRMVKAMLIGSNVEVAAGVEMGGDFHSTPLCRRATQTGCVVTYASFRAERPVPADSRFGRASASDRTVGCTNPAALAGGTGALDAVLPTVGFGAAASPQAPWVSGGAAITTPFVRVPGLLSAECRIIDGASVLAITTHGDPADPRTDTIGGDVVAGGQVLSGWGLHLTDMNLAQGDLVALVAAGPR